jgi:hypothetical protein
MIPIPVYATAWRKFNDQKGHHHGVTQCAIVLEDCLCDTPYMRPHRQRSVLHRFVAAGAQQEKEEPSPDEGIG